MWVPKLAGAPSSPKPSGQPVAAASEWPLTAGSRPPVRLTLCKRTKNMKSHHRAVLDEPQPSISDRKAKCIGQHESGLDCGNGFVELTIRMKRDMFRRLLAQTPGVTDVKDLPTKAGTGHECNNNIAVSSKRLRTPLEFELTRHGHVASQRQPVVTAQFLHVNAWEPAMLEEGYRILDLAVGKFAKFPEMFASMRTQHVRWWNERLQISEIANAIKPKKRSIDSELLLERSSTEGETSEEEDGPASGSLEQEPAAAAAATAASSSAQQPAAAAVAEKLPALLGVKPSPPVTLSSSSPLRMRKVTDSSLTSRRGGGNCPPLLGLASSSSFILGGSWEVFVFLV